MARFTEDDFIAAAAGAEMREKKEEEKEEKKRREKREPDVPLAVVRERGDRMADHELRSMARDFLEEKEHAHLWRVVQHNMPAIVHLLGTAPPSSIARLALTWIQLLEQERDSG